MFFIKELTFHIPRVLPVVEFLIFFSKKNIFGCGWRSKSRGLENCVIKNLQKREVSMGAEIQIVNIKRFFDKYAPILLTGVIQAICLDYCQCQC